MKSLILMLSLLMAPLCHAATQKPESVIETLLTTDVLGYTCVLEEDLDTAFMNGGKGASVPQTCISEAPTKDCESLTSLLGREATADQCATHAYRWLTRFDPDRSTGWGWDCSTWDCTIPEPHNPPEAVPIPGAALMLVSALALLTLMRRVG